MAQETTARSAPQAPIVRRRFTVADLVRMREAGLVGPDERVELLDGELVVMPSMSSRHARCVRTLDRSFQRTVGDRAIVATQTPIQLDRTSAPEPDIALLRPRADEFGDSHPEPPDVLLVIEVGLTSAQLDREFKAPLYARGLPSSGWSTWGWRRSKPVADRRRPATRTSRSTAPARGSVPSRSQTSPSR